MARELLLLRHAETGPKAPDGTDAGRPLTMDGEADAARVGAWLRRHGRAPDLALVSPAVRARRTAELACEAAGLPDSRVTDEPGLYQATPLWLLSRIHRFPAAARRVLVVGHNPGLSALASALAGRDVDLAPAGLAILQGPEDWAAWEPGAVKLATAASPRLP